MTNMTYPWNEKSEEAWAALTEGKNRPVAIWNNEQVERYYRSSEIARSDWDAYAEREAVKFNDNPRLDSYDSTRTHVSHDPDTGKITSWAVPMRFEDWKRATKHANEKE